MDIQLRDKKIVTLREQGMKQSEIAEAVGCSLDVVKNTCRKFNITEKQEKITVEQAAEVISRCGFDYVSGFVNTHSKVLVSCPKCGATFETMYSTIRKSVNGFYNGVKACPGCNKQEREQQKAQREEEQSIQRTLAEQNKLLRESLKVNNELLKLLKIRTCLNCGKQYTIQVTRYNSKKYCSDLCQKRWLNRSGKDKRIKRIKSSEYDDSITIEKLYQRDDGICYLCGCICNWDDIKDAEGTRIAGNSYPSVEHVVPLSKGGKHTWGNVRLACRSCNSKKGNRDAPLLQK